MRFQLDRRQAVLVAIFPFVALSLLNHFYTARLFNEAVAAFWLVDTVHFVAVPSLGWYLVLRPASIGAADCGLGLANGHHRALASGPTIFLALVLLAWTWPVSRVLGLLFWGQCCTFQIQQAIPGAPVGAWLVSIYLAATAALAEELVYRALPWLYAEAVVSSRWRRTAYVLVTSVVFALAHSEQGPGGILATFWYGIVSARMYSCYRSLWPLVLGHFLFNLIVFAPWTR